MNLNKVRKIDGAVPIRNVLVSVSNKKNLERLAFGLGEFCPSVTIYSTGGSFSALSAMLPGIGEKVNLRPVTEYTGQPEMQGGLVKTLDYRIYLGLLSETYNPAHTADLKRTKSVVFDLVVVNLYPFQEAASMTAATLEDGRTHIDIGGPCMLRAAAKNFLRVAALTDPDDYEGVLNELKDKGGTLSLKSRFQLSRKAFATTAAYDAAIASYFSKFPENAADDLYDFARG